MVERKTVALLVALHETLRAPKGSDSNRWPDNFRDNRGDSTVLVIRDVVYA
jgi:hypothetical protein